MTPDQAERIGRLYLSDGEPWQPGMLAQNGPDETHSPVRIVRVGDYGVSGLTTGVFGREVTIGDDAWPDPRDAATVGAMLGIARLKSMVMAESFPVVPSPADAPQGAVEGVVAGSQS